MEAHAVLEVLEQLERAGVDVWILGGWGVDALVGRQTRHHGDLDIILTEDHLSAAHATLRRAGFTLRHVWPESRPLPGGEEHPEGERPTAFVLGHPDGRLIDVHVLGVDEDGTPIPRWESDLTISWETLDGRGTIAGSPVACLTAEMQLACHEGYVLPREHADDVELLRAMIAPE